MQARCFVELLHRGTYERCYLRDVGPARGAAARNLEVDRHAIERVPDVVGQLLQLS